MKKSLFISVLALSSLLHADYVLEYKMDKDIQKFIYHSSSKSKLVMPSDEASAIYKIGKKSYIVSGKGQHKKIVDVDEMRAMANSFGYDPSEYEQEELFHPKITKSSKRVTIAGIKGQVWSVSASDGSETQEIVVTNDTRVVKTVRAMEALFRNMSGADAENGDMLEIEKGYVIIKADDLKLHSFKEKDINSQEYALPTDAKRESMPKFDRKKLEALQKKLEEHQRDAEENVDADKAVDMLKSFF